MLTLKFRHNYYKLGKLQFTTIRGKSWMKKLRAGMKVELDTLTGKRLATVIKIELKIIREIPLDVLKLDGEYPGFEIDNHLAFVSLLNSFRQKIWTSKPVAPEDEMTIITLQQ